MDAKVSIPDNHALRDFVDVAFRFLVDEYEFDEAVSQDCWSVEMRSPKLVVGFHRERHLILDLTVTRRDNDRKYSLWSIISVVAPESLRKV